MKIGIALLAVVTFVLLIVSGLLFVDDYRVRQQLNREREEIKSEMREQVEQVNNELSAARAEVARLNNEIAFPIQITQKKAAAGNNYLVQIFNKSDQTLPVTVTFSNATLKRWKNFEVDLSPGFSRDISRVEGWTAAVGDSLHVACPGSQPVKRSLR